MRKYSHPTRVTLYVGRNLIILLSKLLHLFSELKNWRVINVLQILGITGIQIKYKQNKCVCVYVCVCAETIFVLFYMTIFNMRRAEYKT